MRGLVNKRLGETLGEGLSDRLCERFGKMLCNRKNEMFILENCMWNVLNFSPVWQAEHSGHLLGQKTHRRTKNIRIP